MKDESIIPYGMYCYNAKGTCVYWSLKDDREEQYNGWCDFLEKGDLELEKEMVLKDMQGAKEVFGDELPFPVSLLWDQCKECGINN